MSSNPKAKNARVATAPAFTAPAINIEPKCYAKNGRVRHQSGQTEEYTSREPEVRSDEMMRPYQIRHQYPSA